MVAPAKGVARRRTIKTLVRSGRESPQLHKIRGRGAFRKLPKSDCLM